MTRSQAVALKGKIIATDMKDIPVINGNLDDIMHAIQIEETPIVQADFIGEDEHKQKKAKSVKKLEFEGENVAFIFQARKPITRHAKKFKEGNKEVQEPIETAKAPEEVVDLSSPTIKHASSRTKKGKEEMTEFQHLEEKLRLENQEIVVMRKRARKHSVEKAEFKRIKTL